MKSSPKKILIIDDETIVRNSLNRILKNQGYEVRIAENGEEGLRLLSGFEPDLIFLDWIMPKMGGQAFLEFLRIEGKIYKIILMSAYSQDTSLRDLESYGIKLYLNKPLPSINDIKKIVCGVLGE